MNENKNQISNSPESWRNSFKVMALAVVSAAISLPGFKMFGKTQAINPKLSVKIHPAAVKRNNEAKKNG